MPSPSPSADSPKTPSQRGVILVWVAAFMFITLCFVALGIDLAKLFGGRTQLQNAADAAALAGASALDPTTGTIVQTVAVERAQQAGQNNEAFIDDPQPVVVDPDDVEFIGNDVVRVTVRRQGANSIIAHFAQVLGVPTLEMTAVAAAKVDTARGVSCGTVPLAAVPNAGTTFELGCDHIYQLKLGGGEGLNGNYYALDFPPCDEGPCQGMNPTGGNTYRCLLGNSYCCELTIGDVLMTEPGDMSGPTRQAINDRFNADVVRTEDICYADYLAAGGNGERVVVVPITTPPDEGGRGPVTIVDLGAFFLRSKPGAGTECIIMGEFVRAIRPGTAGGGGGGPITFTLRLIQ